MTAKKSLWLIIILFLCMPVFGASKRDVVVSDLNNSWADFLISLETDSNIFTNEQAADFFNIFAQDFQQYKNSSECYVSSLINRNYKTAIEKIDFEILKIQQSLDKGGNPSIQSYYRELSAALFLLMGEAADIGQKSAKASIFIFSIFILLVVLLSVGLFSFVTRFEKLRGETKEMGYYSDFMFQGIQNERNRISRELHDTVCQDLRAARLELELMQVEQDLNKEKQNTIVSVLSKCIKDLREICNNLSPIGSKNVKQTSVWQAFISSLENLIEAQKKRTGISFNVKIEPIIDAGNLTFYKCGNIFRIIQEALNNIEKHSQATEVSILIRNDEKNQKKTILFFIVDNGIGIKNGTISGLHFGMSNMKQRALDLGATFEIISEPDDGTKIRLEVPVQ